MAQKKIGKASTVLGILSICLFFTSWPGLVLGIIGVSLKKRPETRGRDIALNVIGMVMSFIWLCYVFGTL